MDSEHFWYVSYYYNNPEDSGDYDDGGDYYMAATEDEAMAMAGEDHPDAIITYATQKDDN